MAENLKESIAGLELKGIFKGIVIGCLVLLIILVIAANALPPSPCPAPTPEK
jgi:hypothetical protein